MSTSPLSSTAPGTRFRLWLGWLFLGVALVAVAGVAVIIDRLRERADECRRAQTELASLRADAHELDALEWETVHKAKVNKETSEQLEKIQTQGGRIGVESEPGKGSVFTVVLPVRTGERQTA